MSFNKYDYIDDLYALQKPRQRGLPSFKLDKFERGSYGASQYKTVSQMANFGMEMMKFMPKWERMVYAGKAYEEFKGPTAEADKAKWQFVIKHGTNPLYNPDIPGLDALDPKICEYVTPEFWQAFGGEEKQAEINAWEAGHPGKDADGNTIIVTGGDGLTDWRDPTNSDALAGNEVIDFGDFHNVGPIFSSPVDFGIWGGDMGAEYKNLDFSGNALNFTNNIYTSKDKTDLDGLAAVSGDAQDPDVIAGLAAANIGSLSDAAQIIEDDMEGKLQDGDGYYEIIQKAYGDYTKYNAPNQTLDVELSTNLGINGKINQQKFSFALTMLMEESRYRVDTMLSTVFGPLQSTISSAATPNNDQIMIDHIDGWMNSVKGVNPHDLQLFEGFLGMQHVYTNVSTSYFASDPSMTQSWFDRKVYNGQIDNGGTTDPFSKQLKSLAEGFSRKKIARQAVGAYFVTDSTETHVQNSDGKQTTDVAIPFLWENDTGNGENKFGYDRIYYTDNFSSSDVPNSNPHASEDQESHANMVRAQLTGLTIAQMDGRDNLYKTNWAVHAVGKIDRESTLKDNQLVASLDAMARQYHALDKQDMRDYYDRKEELEYEKAQEEGRDLQYMAKERAEQQKADKEQEAKRRAPQEAQKKKAKSPNRVGAAHKASAGSVNRQKPAAQTNKPQQFQPGGIWKNMSYKDALKQMRTNYVSQAFARIKQNANRNKG